MEGCFVGTMETLCAGKMDNTPTSTNRKKSLNILDAARNSFSCVIHKPAHLLYEQCQKHSDELEVLDFSLSNQEISISSHANFSSAEFTVKVPTVQLLSFGIYHKSLTKALRMLTKCGKDKREMVLVYRAKEKMLILAGGRTRVIIKTDSHLYRKNDKAVTQSGSLESVGCLTV